MPCQGLEGGVHQGSTYTYRAGGLGVQVSPEASKPIFHVSD